MSSVCTYGVQSTKQSITLTPSSFASYIRQLVSLPCKSPAVVRPHVRTPFSTLPPFGKCPDGTFRKVPMFSGGKGQYGKAESEVPLTCYSP